LIAAVIFDMDGLMIDSEPLQKQAWQMTACRYGRVIDDALFTQMLGLRDVESTDLVIRAWGLPLDAKSLWTERDELYLSNLPGRLRAMPGLYELLAELQARGLRRAVATSGVRRYVEIVMRELGLENAWDALVVSQDVSRGKPAPDVYLLAAQRLNVPPAQCLVLEDAPNGIAAAKAAGMKCAAVPNDDTRALDLSAADVVLPSLLAVRDGLDGLLR
jgi:HAD superfamily hydrolase (TIGR01509 family)